jgi:hypothetical protein
MPGWPSAAVAASLREIKPKGMGEAQELFMQLLPRLIDYVHSQGYKLRGGDLFRDARAFGEVGVSMAYGHPKSGHKKRLAIDLNLFKNGAYLEKTEDHAPFGAWWKLQHELCRWGGDFKDGNHYSIEWDGIK